MRKQVVANKHWISNRQSDYNLDSVEIYMISAPQIKVPGSTVVREESKSSLLVGRGADRNVLRVKDLCVFQFTPEKNAMNCGVSGNYSP
jgi:hypothetical protein